MSTTRLQKFLANAGVASRRSAEDLIRAGRVRVNAAVVTELGTKIDPDRDRVEVDGRLIRQRRPIWILLNKPRGYVTTRQDPQGRPTIYELLPASLRGLFYVGRLDVNTEGLLLLTNAGDIANRLLHPRYRVPRVYDVLVAGVLSERTLRKLLSGVTLEDGVARASEARIRATKKDRTRLQLTLEEGRKREVRRLLKTVGHPVLRLRRIRYGPIALGNLPVGKWRRLTQDEIRSLPIVEV